MSVVAGLPKGDAAVLNGADHQCPLTSRHSPVGDPLNVGLVLPTGAGVVAGCNRLRIVDDTGLQTHRVVFPEGHLWPIMDMARSGKNLTSTLLRNQRHDSESNLVESARNGEDWAWEAIYAELAGPITGYLRSRGAKEPEDLSSEVFYQVARDIHRFEGDDESKFRSWVFVIAHRRLIDSRRAEGRRPVTVDEPVATFEASGGDVEREVMEELGTSHVARIFRSLTDEQQQVLSLRIIANLTLEETASVMGKQVNAIKALQRRALASVKSQIDQGRVTL
jgi:RNA polymerase sigma factor (sigma-70 family)